MLRRAVTLSKLLRFGPPAIHDGASHASCTSMSGRSAVLQHNFSTAPTRCQSGNSLTAADTSDTDLQKKAAVRPCQLSFPRQTFESCAVDLPNA